ncbi:MAG: hypothetical protein OXH50_03750, partial [Gemmatimonadetes bacterium]|nr:hypothetical protein [Gemmatimonadota bacterium]
MRKAGSPRVTGRGRYRKIQGETGRLGDHLLGRHRLQRVSHLQAAELRRRRSEQAHRVETGLFLSVELGAYFIHEAGRFPDPHPGQVARRVQIAHTGYFGHHPVGQQGGDLHRQRVQAQELPQPVGPQLHP